MANNIILIIRSLKCLWQACDLFYLRARDILTFIVAIGYSYFLFKQVFEYNSALKIRDGTYVF